MKSFYTWGKVLRLPLSREIIEWPDWYNEALISEITVDGQSLKAMVDTGTDETFFISSQSFIDGKLCDELFYGCYQCRPEVCAAESTGIEFKDGRRVNLVPHSGTLDFGQERVTEMKFGIIKDYFGLPHHASLGLAPKPEDDNEDFIPLLDQLVDKKLIAKREFSMYFEPDNINKGELILGGKDITIYQEPSLQVPLTVGKNTWRVDLKDITIGGKLIQSARSSYSILVDSGADCLFGPLEVVRPVLAVIEASLTVVGRSIKFNWDGFDGRDLQSCDDRKYLPSIKLTFRGESDTDVILEIPSELYVRESPNGHSCTLLIKEVPRGFAVGVSLLRKYHLHFQVDKRQIGFALSKGESRKQTTYRKRRLKGLKLPKLRSCLGCISPLLVY
ncbi:hypothetical protein FOL47_001626 [Perkinsus chesapeaki]|uniref:Peptidase A1 domain-containing protein n=1 Tax=Perkinsus chesapeaki TaxID=330153 RepID=A0A7J6N1B9_PERCH|nr:hypothetical protein FOL47_001626 [Perkinsus chesapeaki]